MDGLFSPEIISTSNEHILRSNFLFMPKNISTLENNFLYRILTNENGFHVDSVNQVNCLLHEQHEIAELTDPNEGSLFHVICRNSKNQKFVRIIFFLFHRSQKYRTEILFSLLEIGQPTSLFIEQCWWRPERCRRKRKHAIA